MLVAHHINAMQYVALQMMIAKHFGWKVGSFILSTTFISMIISLNKQRNCSAVSQKLPTSLVLVCQIRLISLISKAEDFELVIMR